MCRIIFPNTDFWEEVRFLAENTWKAMVLLMFLYLSHNSRFHVTSWYGSHEVENRLFLIWLSAAVLLTHPPAPPGFSFSCIYFVSCSDHLSLSALSRSSTCKYIKNAIRFHSHISLVYWLLCKAEKGFSGSMWPLNYATSKPWRLNQHFLLSYILASFPNKGDVSVCGRLKCRWIQEA